MNAKTHIVDIAKLDRAVIASQYKVHLIVGGSLMGNQGYTCIRATTALVVQLLKQGLPGCFNFKHCLSISLLK